MAPTLTLPRTSTPSWHDSRPADWHPEWVPPPRWGTPRRPERATLGPAIALMAEKLGTQTFAGLSQNLAEKLSLSMRPTGDLALSGGVKAGTGVLGELIGNFGKMNQATGGVVGVLGLLGLGIPILRDFFGQVTLARNALRMLGGEGVIGGAGRPITVTGGH